jgi:hypothetical protein
MSDAKTYKNRNSACNAKYHKEKLDNISIRIHKGIRSKIQVRAALLGKSMARYILECIQSEMDDNNWPDDVLSKPTDPSDANP